MSEGSFTLLRTTILLVNSTGKSFAMQREAQALTTGLSHVTNVTLE